MTNSEMAILTLLAEAPRHGYELEQIIEDRGMREWTEIGFSSIYYILKKIEKKGWVFAYRKDSESRGPGKIVYDLTDAGRGIWLDTALNLLRIPIKNYDSLDLGLANLPGLPAEDVIAALTERRAIIQRIIDHVINRSNLDYNQVPHVEIMFDHSLTLLKAELDWLERPLSRLGQSFRATY